MGQILLLCQNTNITF